MREDSFDAVEYFGHLRSRWRFLALACSVALAAALAISLLLPKKYTASTRIIIEAPAGSDPRAATAVSPIYIDSLRTYEHFASSDSLFLRALDQFHLRGGNAAGRPIESWKRSILKVDIPRGTKILEISATLPDPRQAHALALFLAEETLNLSRKVNRSGDEELVAELQHQVDDAAGKLRSAEQARDRFLATDPAERLQAEAEAAEYSSGRIEEQLVPAEIDLAEAADRAKSGERPDMEGTRDALRSARIRVDVLRKERDRLKAEISDKRQRVALARAREDELTATAQTARTTFEALETRLRETRASVGFRGEQLKMVDTGIVPERPSSPNVPLNLVAAVLLAFTGALLFTTVEFSLRRMRGERVRQPLRMTGTGV